MGVVAYLKGGGLVAWKTPLLPTARFLRTLQISQWGSVILMKYYCYYCQTPQAYKDSDFKQYWMPDGNCKECYECGDKFNTFRRRHHCRICGQIFCSRCCNQEVPGNIMGYTGNNILFEGIKGVLMHLSIWCWGELEHPMWFWHRKWMVSYPQQ